jgi:hypothetical protein
MGGHKVIRYVLKEVNGKAWIAFVWLRRGTTRIVV